MINQRGLSGLLSNTPGVTKTMATNVTMPNPKPIGIICLTNSSSDEISKYTPTALAVPRTLAYDGPTASRPNSRRYDHSQARCSGRGNKISPSTALGERESVKRRQQEDRIIF
jgi:hypothetical protein